MRRPWTGLLAVAVAAIAVAALVDALVDRRRDETRRDESAADARPLPACRRDQLALALEHLGGSTAVALRHVAGPPCHRSPMALRAVVVDSRGVRSRLPLADERILQGDFTPGFEQLVVLSSCGDAAPSSTVEASAGPYSTRGQARFGTGCGSIQYERVVEIGASRGTRRFAVSPLDTATHEVSFVSRPPAQRAGPDHRPDQGRPRLHGPQPRRPRALPKDRRPRLLPRPLRPAGQALLRAVDSRGSQDVARNARTSRSRSPSSRWAPDLSGSPAGSGRGT